MWLCSRAESIFIIRMCALLSIHTYAWQCFDLTKNMKKTGGKRGENGFSAPFFDNVLPKLFFSFFGSKYRRVSVGTGRAYLHTYGLTFYKSPLLLHTKNIFFQNFLFRPKCMLLPPARSRDSKKQDLLKLLQKNIRYKIPVFFIEKCEEIYTDTDYNITALLHGLTEWVFLYIQHNNFFPVDFFLGIFLFLYENFGTGRAYLHTYLRLNFLPDSATPYQKYFFPRFPFSANFQISFFIEKLWGNTQRRTTYYDSAARTDWVSFFYIQRHNFFPCRLFPGHFLFLCENFAPSELAASSRRF